MKTVLRNAFLSGLLPLLAMLSMPSFASEPLKGAVCIIRSEVNLVMVKEILTNKWSLPAGTIEAGEPPQQAAQREVWEETGLVVNVGKELWRSENAVFFDCESESPLIAFAQQDAAGGYVLPIWFAPDYGVEVARAHLIDARTVAASEYRYPQQWHMIQELYMNASSQGVSFVDSLVEAAPVFNQLELPWMAKMQAWLLYGESSLAQATSTFLLMGLLLTSPLFLLLLPLSYAYFGRDFTLKLIFTLIFGALVVQLGKLGFQLPRPFVYQPSLNLAEQVGYGLPSMSVTLWTICIAMINSQLGFKSWNRFSVACSVALIWLITALFYSASTFLIDSFIGVLFGWLCAWHMSRLDITIGPKSNELFSNRGVWLALAVFSTVLAAIWQTTILLGIALLVLTLLAMLTMLKMPNQVSTKSSLLTIFVLFLLCVGFKSILEMVNSSNLNSLITYVSLAPTLVVSSTCVLCLMNKKKPSRS